MADNKDRQIQELRDTIARQSDRIAELNSQLSKLQETPTVQAIAEDERKAAQREAIERMPISNWDKISKMRELGLLESDKRDRRPDYSQWRNHAG